MDSRDLTEKRRDKRYRKYSILDYSKNNILTYLLESFTDKKRPVIEEVEILHLLLSWMGQIFIFPNLVNRTRGIYCITQTMSQTLYHL